MDKLLMQARLGVVLREKRQALEHSQDSFADTIGMHRAYYSAIERGERNVTLSTIGRLADGLQTKIAELMSAASL
jgi:transcriptional regulator with XRE-family HTH domain